MHRMNSLKNRFGIADLALILTTFFWGLNAVITKNAVGDSPESFRIYIFNGLRIPACSILLFLTVWISGRSIRIRREHIPLMLSISFFGMFLFMTFFVAALYLTSASNVGMFNATIPLLILIVAIVSKIERPTKRVTAGIIVGFSGVLILLARGGAFAFHPGDAFILMACVCWAFYTVYAKKILTVYEPMLVVAWVYLLTSIFQLPLFLYQLPSQQWTRISPMNWLNLLISTTISLYIANSLYYFAIKKIGPSRVGIYTNLTPVFTIILAVLIRGETITLLQISGLVIIIIGIFISKSGPVSKSS